MKTQVYSIFRLGCVAALAGAFCLANNANAQSRAAEPPDDAPPVAKTSMAPVGAKPSKAELAKREAEKEAAAAQGQTRPGTTTAAAVMSERDQQFMKEAAKGGMKEVHMGQMAVQNGQSDEVKKLGQRIVADHTKANNQLLAIAAKRGVKLDTRHKMEKMSKRDMQNFDQAWIAMMINDHQRDIALFQQQAQQGTDPELRKFAKNTLPVLQRHLKSVQQAQKKIGTAGATPRTSSR